MDFKKHLETAWKLMLKYIASLIVITLVMLAVSFFTLGILGPVAIAGYVHSILLMIREEREPNVRDIFSQMNLFLPLLGFSIVVLLAVIVGFSMLVLPGIIIVVAVSYFCLFLLPLMTDKKLGVIDAAKESYSLMTKGELVNNIAVYVLFVAILALGATTFLGSLFTQPFAMIFLMSVYGEKTEEEEQQQVVESSHPE